MATQELFLKLSEGPILSKEIQTVNLNTWDINGRCNAVAVWRKDRTEPQYYPHSGQDAEIIAQWTETQLGEQFLALPSVPNSFQMTHLFAADCIESTSIDEDKAVLVKLKDDPCLWWFSPQSWAVATLLLWSGEVMATSPIAIAS